MPVETAIWFPFWYEMDQSIYVGQVGNFDFFKEPPEYVAHGGRGVFYHGDWQEKCRHLFDRKRARILCIEHPKLGPIRAIDTDGLVYTFTMTDGRTQKVEAEEAPGLAHEHPEQITDWRIYVELEPA